MTKTLRIPDEYRFVRAFALVVDPGDTLALLMEVGALSSADLAIVRRTREALIPAYDRASDLKDWDQAHAISVLREALALSDSAAYLAYQVRRNHRAPHPATEYAAALRSTASLAVAIIGCAADTMTVCRRPWEIESDDLSLAEWRERVWKLLREAIMPDNALPRPSASNSPTEPDAVDNGLGIARVLAGEHTDWCPAERDGGEL
ncbi:MAG TPA: hypothetical protein PKO09_01625 [Anaerolineae bacterium]|nr:hypothetical protein [Anaerolineae bacterium]